MNSTDPELAPDVLAIADEILAEMRGGPILALSPTRSREILARWIVRLAVQHEHALDAAVLAAREACARVCESEAHDEADDRFAAAIRACK